MLTKGMRCEVRRLGTMKRPALVRTRKVVKGWGAIPRFSTFQPSAFNDYLRLENSVKYFTEQDH